MNSRLDRIQGALSLLPILNLDCTNTRNKCQVYIVEETRRNVPDYILLVHTGQMVQFWYFIIDRTFIRLGKIEKYTEYA